MASTGQQPTQGRDREDRQRRALAVPSRRRIFELIAGAAPGAIGVARLADDCGLHNNTVRLHLSVLVDAGLISQELDRVESRGRGPGRPAYRYRAIANPHFEALAAARATGRLIGAAEATRTAGNAVATIQASFTRMGFSPTLVDGGNKDRYAMRLDACPFAAAAAADPDTICSLHRGIAEGLADHDHAVVVDALIPVVDPNRGGCQLQIHIAG